MSAHVPTVFLRPVDTAAFYAIAPPLGGVVLLAAGAIPIAAYLGWFPWNTLLFLLFGGYLYGALPLAATGVVVALSARRGRSFKNLVLISGGYGFCFAGIVALFAALFWWIDTGWQVVVGLAVAGGIAGSGAALSLGFASALLHRRAKTQ
jgi:hypothetical protein